VFTLPGALGPVALPNPREVYGLLMRAASETLLGVAANPTQLGAEVGATRPVAPLVSPHRRRKPSGSTYDPRRIPGRPSTRLRHRADRHGRHRAFGVLPVSDRLLVAQ
jgi:hypothetical protein